MDIMTRVEGDDRADRLLALTVQLVSAHAARTELDPDALPGLIEKVFHSLKRLSSSAGQDAAASTQQDARGDPGIPAVPIAESVTREHIICLEDGRAVKLLHRYLRTHFRMSPAEYRRKWGLPVDYPMVAPAYSESRREHARKVGFQKREQVAKPGRGGRPKLGIAKA